MTGFKTLFALTALLSAGTLTACGPKNPPEPTAPSDAAPPAVSDTASSDATSSQAAAAAISSAAQPAAGTVANDNGDNQKTVKPSATVSEEAQAGGDEASQDLRAKVAAAKAAGKAAGLPKQ